MRLIDLSVTIEQDAVSEIYPPKIEFRSHTGAGLEFFMGAFGVKREDLVYSGGTAPGDEIFTFMSHTGSKPLRSWMSARRLARAVWIGQPFRRWVRLTL